MTSWPPAFSRCEWSIMAMAWFVELSLTELVSVVDDTNSTDVHWCTKINRPPWLCRVFIVCARSCTQIVVNRTWSDCWCVSTALSCRPQQRHVHCKHAFCLTKTKCNPGDMEAGKCESGHLPALETTTTKPAAVEIADRTYLSTISN